MPSPALTVGGTPLYPQAGLLDTSRPVYRPEYGNAGLLSQPKMDNLVRNFAGGLLNGYQVGSTPDANGRYFTPIAPSGVYTTNPGDATTVTDNRTPDDATGMTFKDAFSLAFAPYMARDEMEASGGAQQMIQYAKLARDNPTWVRQRFKGLDLDEAYDPSNEQFLSLMSIVSQAGGARSGGGDGGA
jgi:hypothetical protein